MPRIDNAQLKSFLEDTEKIDIQELHKLYQEAEKGKTSLANLIISSGLIHEEDLRKLEAYILGIPYVDLTKERIDPSILRLIPEPIARKYNIIAFKKERKDLQVAMIDPDDIQIIEFIKKTTDLRILPRLTSKTSIQEAIKQYQKSLEGDFEDIMKKSASPKMTAVAAEVGEVNTEDLKKMAEDLPIIRIVDTLIQHAIIERASDIHIEPAEKEVIVRYRIDGILHDAMILPKKVAPGIVARIKVMANLKIDEHRLPQDGRFRVETADHKLSLRVSILPIFDGEKIVMRLLSEDSKGLSLSEIGLRGDALDKVHAYIKKPVGIILVTGPTGSGKTTTLYSILEILNTPEVNISTVEDPIEYRMPRVNQTQVKPEIGLSFASGLRSLLRQDPNIIMVGEIRDEETASLAINAALTGHLVLSTLHTNSAAGALPRLLEMGVEPFLIASTVNIIVAQRLVRRLCETKDKTIMTQEAFGNLVGKIDAEKIIQELKRDRIVDAKTAFEKIQWSHPEKSEECPDGYKGRMGIYEVLEVTTPIKELIMKNSTSDDIEKRAREEGMITMLEDGVIKAAEGRTTLEEILRVTSE